LWRLNGRKFVGQRLCLVAQASISPQTRDSAEFAIYIPLTGLYNLPFPYPAGVARLLNRHFRITGRGYLHEVRRHFATIYAALESPIDFECEKSCDAGVAAYVYSVWSDVHLCPVWYAQTPNGRANTIIHEIAHDAANRDDEAYIWEASYNTLSVEDAIDNADSYSNFAEEAYAATP
jgi:Lysine-specific metallo-endopeptidase